MTQCLGRRSMPGGLNLPCTQSVVDMLTTLLVNYLLWVSQPGELSFPSIWGC